MSESTPPSGTAPGSLTGFIFYSLKLGHTLQGIRSTLIRSGVDVNVVDRSLLKHSPGAPTTSAAVPASPQARKASPVSSITTTSHLEEFTRMMATDVKVELDLPKQNPKPRPKAQVAEPTRLELRPPRRVEETPRRGLLDCIFSALFRR